MNLSQLSNKIEKCCKEIKKHLSKDRNDLNRKHNPYDGDVAIEFAAKHNLKPDLIVRIITGKSITEINN